jgi:hypothetical protein
MLNSTPFTSVFILYCLQKLSVGNLRAALSKQIASYYLLSEY